MNMFIVKGGLIKADKKTVNLKKDNSKKDFIELCIIDEDMMLEKNDVRHIFVNTSVDTANKILTENVEALKIGDTVIAKFRMYKVIDKDDPKKTYPRYQLLCIEKAAKESRLNTLEATLGL